MVSGVARKQDRRRKQRHDQAANTYALPGGFPTDRSPPSHTYNPCQKLFDALTDILLKTMLREGIIDTSLAQI